MRQCAIVQDLLPLYIDDALSPESRELVEGHLAECETCRRVLRGLQSAPLPGALPDTGGPSADARFLIRLKRQAGTVLGIVLVVVVATALVAGRLGAWRQARELARAQQRVLDEQAAALLAIAEASPDPLARLRRSGVVLSAEAARSGALLDVRYALRATSPAAQAGTFGTAYAPQARLLDPESSQELARFVSGGASMSMNGVGEGSARFEDLPSGQTRVDFQLPMLAVYFTPDQPIRWQIERPGERGQARVEQMITVGGVEFRVDRIGFDGDRVRIDYHQLTPQASVGVHYLVFRLDDRMGHRWGGDYGVDYATDPLNPHQDLAFISSLSQSWTLSVERAMLVLPGPTLPLEVK